MNTTPPPSYGSVRMPSRFFLSLMLAIPLSLILWTFLIFAFRLLFLSHH